MNIRLGQKKDIAQIAKIFRLIREHDLDYLPKLHTPLEDLEYFREKVFKEDKILVVEQEEKIVGFCGFKDGWIDHLYILPEFQNQGLGKDFIDRVKESSFKIQLWVFQKNTKAIKFYENNGFKLLKVTNGEENEEKEPDALYSWEK